MKSMVKKAFSAACLVQILVVHISHIFAHPHYHRSSYEGMDLSFRHPDESFGDALLRTSSGDLVKKRDYDNSQLWGSPRLKKYFDGKKEWYLTELN